MRSASTPAAGLRKGMVTPRESVYARPVVMESVPRVVISGLMPSRVTISPLHRPTKPPTARTARIAGTVTTPAFVSNANVTAPSGTTPETERSNPPEMMVSTWPPATRPITVTLLRMLRVLE